MRVRSLELGLGGCGWVYRSPEGMVAGSGWGGGIRLWVWLSAATVGGSGVLAAGQAGTAVSSFCQAGCQSQSTGR
jgi:hypothetical protein